MRTARVAGVVGILTALAATAGVARGGLADTDHYTCYMTRAAPFARRTVSLVDQFVSTTATVVRPLRFCNPADKNGEGIVDPTAHLMCYRLSEPFFTRRTVLVRNQFGDQTLTVVGPESLCNPAEQDGVPSPLGINHYKCYRVKARRTAPLFVNVVDQFESADLKILAPRLLCNPVDKNGEGVVDPVAHLVCYTIGSSSAFRAKQIGVVDQFGAQVVTTLPGRCSSRAVLCVPSEKNPDTTTTTVAPTTSTTTTTVTTTTTTDTVPESTTTTTEPRVAICGNGEVEDGEDCDPPGSACQCPPDPPGLPSGTCDDFCTCFCAS